MTTFFRPKWAVAALVALLLVGADLSAQWLEYRVPGTPRLADGTADLRAPAPRTADGRPDLSGIWAAEKNRPPGPPGPGFVGNRHNENLAVDLPGGAPLTPWGEEILAERRRTRAIPTERCLPAGIPPDTLRPQLPFKVIQTPAVVAILIEEFNNWRQLHLDGRTLPENPQPAFYGYSVANWDGDTLVVMTTGVNDKTWLDGAGMPHSAALRLTERIRRSDFGRLEITYSFDDPQAFTRPWSATVRFDLQPDTELLEHQCENDKWSQRVLAGASAGGLFTLYTMYSRPELFTAYVALTPALIVGDGWLLKYEEEVAKSGNPLNVRLYVSMGENEGPGHLATILRYNARLTSRSHRGLAYEFRVIDGERHAGLKNEGYTRGLRFAFAPVAPERGPSTFPPDVIR